MGVVIGHTRTTVGMPWGGSVHCVCVRVKACMVLPGGDRRYAGVPAVSFWRCLELHRIRIAIVIVATALAWGALSGAAYARTVYTGVCTSCHRGVDVPVSASLVSNSGSASTFSYSAPTADAVAVFAGSVKQVGMTGATGQFTVANGQIYTLYAVAGPGTNTGIGQTTVTAVNPPPTSEPPAPVDERFTYIAGNNRFDTAIQASRHTFPTGAPAVVIATGRNWPDALGGGALAAAVGGPVLLTEPAALPSSVSDEIVRLGARKAYVLGGTSAVSTGVELSLAGLLGSSNVTRIAGRSRYQTAEEIARAVTQRTAGAPEFTGGAFLATGVNFPDALAATPLSVATRRPIFLVGPQGLAPSTWDAMQSCGVDEVVVLGGTAAVSTAVENELAGRFGASEVHRLAGANRYATAVDVATYGVSRFGLSWDGLAIATGTGFPDALAGGVMQGLADSVMLLTTGTELHSATRACIETHRAAIDNVSFLGGMSAVSEAVRSQVGAALGSGTPDPDPDADPDPDIEPEPDPNAPHAALRWSNYPANCLSCHPGEFGDAYQGVHYQWQGQAPENVNQPGILQGKLTNAINSYCVSVGDNWQICGKCHAGRGAVPVWTQTPTREQLLNVDCLVCHNDDYSKVRTRLADGSLGPSTTDTALLDSYVRTIKAPTRASCLSCHAYAGGGDAVKRGDLSWATANTTDRNYDVHMATTGGDLSCQSCHAWSKHKVTGRGSDLRVTDNPGEVTCSTSTCHPGDNVAGHSSAVQKHVARVACQTCHIPAYGRNAADSAATEATEIDRNWLVTNVSGAKPWHPGSTKANNVTPAYRWWNGTNDNMLLRDANLTLGTDGTYATSKPVGTVNGSGTKLYPFKYKTATQPMRAANRMLVGIDTLDYMIGSGNPYTATGIGLTKMGFASTDAVDWVKTSTYQALNHSVPPATDALQCADCHGSTTRMNLKADLGYALKGPESTVCVQCHNAKSPMTFAAVHSRHARYECSFCHTFSRPERGLRTTP